VEVTREWVILEALATRIGRVVSRTTLLGTMASFGVARTVVNPLSRLRTRVEQVPAEDPGAAVLEIDALRTSLNEAFTRLGAALLQSRRLARDAAHQLANSARH
jgi:hypothetical protein